ncbi:MAG: hypothetical protein V3W41_21255 [Planctomycetota bacterium]
MSKTSILMAILIVVCSVGALIVSSKENEAMSKKDASGDVEQPTSKVVEDNESDASKTTKKHVADKIARNEFVDIEPAVTMVNHLSGDLFYTTAQDQVIGLLKSLESLRSLPGLQRTDNGRTHPALREVKVTAEVDGMKFTETLRGQRHTVNLETPKLVLNYTWLGKSNDIPDAIIGIVTHKTEGGIGEKRMFRLSIQTVAPHKMSLTPRVWKEDYFAHLSKFIGLPPMSSEAILMAFSENTPDASFQSLYGS